MNREKENREQGFNRVLKEESRVEKVAIIGLSCLFPGAHSPKAFWQNLMAGKVSTAEATAADFGVDINGLCNEKGVSDKMYALNRGSVGEFDFDPTGYDLAATEVAQLDRTAKGALYVAKAALKDSGYWDNKDLRSRCGAVIGNLSLPTQASYHQIAPLYRGIVEPAIEQRFGRSNRQRLEEIIEAPEQEREPVSQWVSSLPSDIVARSLSLSAPHFCVDAAYASAFYALKLACDSLLAGKTDLMLTGAVAFTDPLLMQMLFSGLQALPSNGFSCPFDRNSQGLTPAEGASMVVLKRHSEAVRDGDKIYAAIAGIGLSNDGHNAHLLQPSLVGQTTAFERAYRAANIDPSQIDYLECHATGTPLGDKTELSSIKHFFGAHTPLLGATKANVGHLLAASGMVGLLKVILSMEKGTIPPTVGIQEPVSVSRKDSRGVSSDHTNIVQHSTPWPRADAAPKHAAISAFGFGGTNAHVVLQQAKTNSTPSVSPSELQPPQPVAIVGMDVYFSGCDGLEAFDRSLYDGKQQFRDLPEHRWRGVEKLPLLSKYGLDEAPKGAYIEQFDVDTRRYKIPPHEVHRIHPQQLLMLKVADRALQDAGMTPGGNVAVIVATELDPSVHQLQQRWQTDSVEGSDVLTTPITDLIKESFQPSAEVSDFVGIIGNITASRISSLWDFNGPAFTLSTGEQSTMQALEVAQRLLGSKEVDAVVLGAVDLASGFEQVLSRQKTSPLNSETQTWSYEQTANGQMVGEGAGAVVLKRAYETGAEGYATIGAVEICTAAGSALEKAVQDACKLAHKAASTAPAEVGYLEVCSSAAAVEAFERSGLAQAYQLEENQQKRSCAMGSVSATIGYAGIAAGMASLIKAALCLHHRYIPAVPLWSAPEDFNQWKKTPFYVAQASQSWFLAKHQQQRKAAISQISKTSAAHVVLLEATQRVRPSSYLAQSPPYLLVFTAASCEEICVQLSALKQTLEERDLTAIARQSLSHHKAHHPYALSLVCDTKQGLAQEIDRALEGIPKAFEQQASEQQKAWQTPAGSYFTAFPQGKEGVAFVYPGAFNAYLGQNKDHLKLFPDLFEHSIFQSTGDRYLELTRSLHPRTLKAPSRRQLEKLENRFLADPQAMFEAEMACASLTTEILQKHFKIQPQLAFGYSLGETSMMVAQGVFDAAEFGEGRETFARSPLFNGRLSGVQNAVREYWNMPTLDVEEEAQKQIWAIYVLMAPIEAVAQAVESESKVYVTQINTKEEVVIAGEPAACDRLIKSLACPFFRAPFTHVIHCPPVALEKAELENLHTFSIHQKPLTLYTAASREPALQTQQAISGSIAQGLCQTLDFPQLINRVYKDGARVFVEVGAGGSCCRYIEKNLGQRPHVTAALNVRGTHNKAALVKALAKLVSHRVPLELWPLCPPEPNRSLISTKNNAMTKTIELGGKDIAETILNAVLPSQQQSASAAVDSAVISTALAANAAMSQAHGTFLSGRSAALQHMRELIELQLELSASTGSSKSAIENSLENDSENSSKDTSGASTKADSSATDLSISAKQSPVGGLRT